MIDDAFDQFDEDKSGTIDFKELIKMSTAFINSIQVSQKALASEVKHFDHNEPEPQWGGYWTTQAPVNPKSKKAEKHVKEDFYI